MELPRPLMPWGTYLELFPREVANALGPLVQRLDLVIGPLRAHGRRGDGDPDGFHGIARRGNYERLLISEWMLADEFPEEFARRAVMGEHGFLELARREPVGSRTSVALFDAGPNQSGAPRIAHLAALIVLARRAEAMGACLHWGVLQQPAETFHTSVTAHTVLHLFQARSSREATEEDIAAWRDLAGSQIGADDLWLIGGRRLSGLPARHGASLLHIHDPIEPETHCLHAVVVEKGRPKPAVTLELPDDALCARLLRDPFCVRTAEPARAPRPFLAPTANLLFAHGGTKLMARSGREHLIVYPIPNSPHAGAGKPKVYHARPPHPILSAGRVGKEFALVTTSQEPDVLQIERVGQKNENPLTFSFRVPSETTVTPPEAVDVLTPCFYLEDALDDAHWLVLVEDRLLRPKGNENDFTLQYAFVEMEHVLAAVSTSTGCSFVGKADSKWELLSFGHDGHKYSHCEFAQVLNAHFGFGGPLMRHVFFPEIGYGIVAIEEAAGQWTVVWQKGFLNLHPPADDRVVGVVALSGGGIVGERDGGYEPGLIVLQKNRRQILVMGRSWTRRAPTASSEIVQITASHHRPDIAYLTVQGELVVYSLSQEAVLYRLETGPSPW